MWKYCLLDMSGYVLSVHKSIDAAINAQKKEWSKNKTKGMDIQKTQFLIKRGAYFYAN